MILDNVFVFNDVFDHAKKFPWKIENNSELFLQSYKSFL